MVQLQVKCINVHVLHVYTVLWFVLPNIFFQDVLLYLAKVLYDMLIFHVPLFRLECRLAMYPPTVALFNKHAAFNTVPLAFERDTTGSLFAL